MRQLFQLIVMLTILELATDAPSFSAPQAPPTSSNAESDLNSEPTDMPGIPAIGQKALALAHDDAYKAVRLLQLAATSGQVDAQASIAFIMFDRLNGHRRGTASRLFTWRETWNWWRLAAHSD